MKKPSDNQRWILHRMAENGWTIRSTALSTWLWDARSRRKSIPKKTLRVLLEQGWIDESWAPDGANYTISFRGELALGLHRLPQTAGAAR